MIASIAGVLGALWMSAPQIESVAPSPLPLDATAEVTGSGFVIDGTSVRIGDTTQRVILVEPDRLRFLVASGTPLGAQTLVVTTGGEDGGVSEVAVEVVPTAPKIQNVEPAPLRMGALATVTGEGFGTVVAVTLDGLACEVTAQTDFLIVFIVPFAADVLGSATLVLESPSGTVSDDVIVVAPAPEIDALIPNPVKAGSLVTVRGRIAPLAMKVAIAAVEVPVLSVRPGPTSETTEIVAWVPRTLAPRPYDVVVSSGGEASRPAGPLVVEAASVNAPEVSGVYPSRAALGADVWVVGAHLDRIVEVIGGPAIVGCERRACRVSTEALALGRQIGALVGDDGAAIFELELIADPPTVPVIDRVEPNPAFRGEKLVIQGAQLAGVRSVVIGGVAQSLDFVDVDRVEVTVAAGTPLGAETLFVAGNAGSEPMILTVLDPLPIEPGPEASEVAVEADVSESGSGSAELTSRAGTDEGCAGGATGWLSSLGPLWLAWRRRARLP